MIAKRIFANIIVIIFLSIFLISRNAYSDDTSNSEHSTYDDKNTADKPLYDDPKYEQKGYDNLDIQNQTEYKDPYEDTQNKVTKNQTYDRGSKVSKDGDADKNVKHQDNIRKYDVEGLDYNKSDYDKVDKEPNIIDLQVPPVD